MSKVMKNFNKSGEGVNDADELARDLDFFENFARRDALSMWIYLCWDHGRNIPTWNLSLLPEEESLDIGDAATSGTQSSSGSGKKTPKKARCEEPEGDALATSVAGLVRTAMH